MCDRRRSTSSCRRRSRSVAAGPVAEVATSSRSVAAGPDVEAAIGSSGAGAESAGSVSSPVVVTGPVAGEASSALGSAPPSGNGLGARNSGAGAVASSPRCPVGSAPNSKTGGGKTGMATEPGSAAALVGTPSPSVGAPALVRVLMRAAKLSSAHVSLPARRSARAGGGRRKARQWKANDDARTCLLEEVLDGAAQVREVLADRTRQHRREPPRHCERHRRRRRRGWRAAVLGRGLGRGGEERRDCWRKQLKRTHRLAGE